MLGHGLDNQLKEEPGELKETGFKSQSCSNIFCLICSSMRTGEAHMLLFENSALNRFPLGT